MGSYKLSAEAEAEAEADLKRIWLRGLDEFGERQAKAMCATVTRMLYLSHILQLAVNGFDNELIHGMWIGVI